MFVFGVSALVRDLLAVASRNHPFGKSEEPSRIPFHRISQSGWHNGPMEAFVNFSAANLSTQPGS